MQEDPPPQKNGSENKELLVIQSLSRLSKELKTRYVL